MCTGNNHFMPFFQERCEENCYMTGSLGMFNKGSILPDILELEAEIIEQENEIRKKAEDMIQEAHLFAERLIEETRKELVSEEKTEREKLLESIDDDLEELRTVEEEKIRELERIIECNHLKVVDSILGRFVPHWHSGLLDSFVE